MSCSISHGRTWTSGPLSVKLNINLQAAQAAVDREVTSPTTAIIQSASTVVDAAHPIGMPVDGNCRGDNILVVSMDTSFID